MTATPDRDPPELLRERIAHIVALMAEHGQAVDLPFALGDLGILRLDLYDQTGEVAELAQSVADLSEAVKHDQRPEWLDWCYWLALAYATRGMRYGRRADYDEAVTWLTRLRRELPEEDFVACQLADVWWERYYLVRYGSGGVARGELAEEADRLVAAVEALRPTDPSSMDGRLWQRTCGLARLERHGLSGDRADLERGIAELAACVWELPPDCRPAFAASQLADGYSDRAILDQDDGSLSLSIETATRGLALPADGDDLAQQLLHHTLAYSSHMRWQASERRDDLERAIEEWRTLVALDEPDAGWEVLQLGIALRQRAELDDSLSDVDESVELLGRLGFTEIEPHLEFSRLAELGRALTVRGTLADDRAALTRADDALTEALRYPSDDDDILSVHLHRLTAGDEALTRDARNPHREMLPSATRMRELLDEGNSALDRCLGADRVARCLLAGVLAFREIPLMIHTLHAWDTARVRELLLLADELVNRPPEWATILATVRGYVTLVEDARSPLTDLTYGVDEFAEMNRVLGAETRTIAAFAAQLRAGFGGDVRGHRSGLRAVESAFGGSSSPDVEAEAVIAVLEACALARTLDFAGALRRIRHARDLLPRLSSTTYHVQVLQPMILNLEWQMRTATGDLDAGEPPPGGRIVVAGMDPGLSALTELMTATNAFVDAIQRSDLVDARAAASGMAGIADDLMASSAIRLGVLSSAGLAWLEVARRDPLDRVAATRAQALFTEAAQLTGGPSFPMWSAIVIGQAEAMRLAGTADTGRTRELGLAALSAHARMVMLQRGPDEALTVAAKASDHAATVADWCLSDGDYDTLVAALDAGRGLALLAATNSRDVESRLTRAGRADLAAEWRATAGHGRDELGGRPMAGDDLLADDGGAPDTLRAQVLAALADGDTAAVADPITTTKIQSGLMAAGADALVYLVPGVGGRSGYSVTVPARGAVSVSTHSDLRIDEATPVGRYASTALRARDLKPVGEPVPDRSLAAGLDAVGAWAWRVAMAGIVEQTTRWPLRRPAHLVLVPMGELALVPWHAAYVELAGRRRYAVADIVFSYSPSARMFCSAARWPTVPISSALVVGNPSGDLTFAGTEAWAIRAAFYPYGIYLGDRAEAGAGTRAQVLDWIRGAAAGASMVHLACHGVVDAGRPAGASLVLADGPLTALEMVEGTRLGALVIDQVFLAACTTSDVGCAYDEAFSLASSFLAAGARTVFGSMWAVPDAETSLLMFMVHHYLVVEGRRPADSLHAAQLWMLNPSRKAPATMPPELADHSDRVGAADPIAWAAFTHLGR